MAFRRAKGNEERRRREWHAWIDCHRAALHAMGLPPEVCLDEEHWKDFLENGYLEWHPEDSAGFVFTHLSSGQLSALLRFLEGQYSGEERFPPLLGWLRVRHQNGEFA